MKKRVIALMLAFVLVLSMGTVAFANGEATPAPVTETEPTPTHAAEATPTTTPEVEATPTPTPAVDPTPTPTPAADPTPTSTPAVEATPTPTPTPEVVLASIRVTQMPDKLEYLCTDTAVDSTGGTLMITFSDGTTQVVDLSAATLSLVKENANTASVNVAYEGMTDSFAVTIEHSYDEGVITTEATATEPGVMTYTCADCGDEQIGEIPMAVATEIASGTCGAEGDNLTWELSDDGMLTISGTGAMDDYSPYTDNAPWYEYRSNIKSVVIGNGVTSIGVSAFNYCYSLTSVDLPDGLTSIGDAAFNTCYNLTNIDIPDGVTRIGENTFDYCTRLTSVELPDSVTCIDDRAFISCHSLTSITIPNSVTNIGKRAFYGCSGLKSITMPASAGIGAEAFNGCSNIINVTLTKGSGTMTNYKDSDYNVDSNYYGWTPWYASRQNTIISVIIEDGVTSIGEHAFFGCDALKRITIPTGVTSINDYAFKDCSALNSIIFDGNAPAIAKEAFAGVTATAYYDKNYDWVADDFQDCGGAITWKAVAEAVVSGTCGADGDNLTWTLDKDGVLTISGIGKMMDYERYSTQSDNTPVAGQRVVGTDTAISAPWYEYNSVINYVVINYGVTNIGNHAFDYCKSIGRIELPASVTSIGNYAFCACAITSIDLPGGITSIGDAAFDDCANLTSINIPAGVTSIGDSTFSGCSITSVDLLAGVTNIDSRAFGGCDSLNVIRFQGDAPAIAEDAFEDVTAIVFYDKTKSWPNDVFQNYGGTLTWKDLAEPIASGTCGANGDNLTWTLDGAGVLTISGTGDICDSFYNSTTATYDTPWYEQRLNIKSVVIENRVTRIGKNAFRDCSELTSIKIPYSLTSIGEDAFVSCSSLTSIKIPQGVTSIGSSAFQYCRGLTSIVMPASVTSIGQYAFYGCTGLKTAGPEYGGYNYEFSWTNKIPDYAFYCCSGLTSVNIPNSVTRIGTNAFSRCSSLTSIKMPASASISNNPFYDCTNISNVTLTKGSGMMTNYSSNVLSSTDNYQYTPWHTSRNNTISVIIEDGVTSIGNNVFRDCSGLTSIEIPKSVISIGSGAFSGCSGLTSIEIPDNVTSISASAFSGCSGLTSITMPVSASIASNSFGGCTNITNVTLTKGSGGMPSYESGTYNVDENYYGWTPWYASRNNAISIIIEDGVTDIGDYAFYACSGLTSIDIPDSVTEIGENAFTSCSGLTSIEIPDGVTFIGKYAFNACGLTNITMPVSATLRMKAFSGCTSITNVTLTKGSGRMYDYETDYRYESYEFSSNHYKWTPWYNSQNTVSLIIQDGVTYIGENAFYRCSGLTNIEIPDGVTSIGSGAFQYCSGLTNIEIPDGVTSIGNNVFRDCSGLTRIVMPASVTSIGQYAFYGCSGLKTAGPEYGGYDYEFSWTNKIPDYAFHGCSGLTSVNIPNSVTSIGDYAFDSTSLTSIEIPDSVTTIGKYTFSCSALSSIDLPDGVTIIGDYAFSDCKMLDKITFYGDAPTIETNTFNGVNAIAYCTGWNKADLQNYGGTITWKVTITDTVSGTCGADGDNLTWSLDIDGVLTISGIGAMADYSTLFNVPWYFYCEGIRKVYIQDGVTSIGNRAFYGCTSLSSIDIPDNVTRIGVYAFYNCSGLTGITMPVSADVRTDSFFGCTNITNVTLTKGGGRMPDYVLNHLNPPNYYGWTPWYVSRNNTISIIIEAGVTNIGNYAFYGCSGLTNIEIPDGVTSIGDNAFNDCANLTNAAIPGSVNTVGTSVFAGCTGLTTAGSLGSGCNIEYGWADTIPVNAFNGCNYLTSVDMPDSITVIGKNAFNGCTSLAAVTLSDGVASIGEDAFSGCTGLTDITMPVSMIDCHAFDQCTGLTSLTLTKGTGTMPNLRFSGDADSFYKNTPWYQSKANSINVVIEEGVTNIGDCVFMGCTGLASIELPDSLTSIGSFAFTYCDSLKEVNFPENLKTIGSYAFYFCDGDPTLKFYGNAPKIDDNSFASTTANAYYLHTTQWEESNLQNYGGKITWQLCCDGFTPCEAIGDEGKEPTFEEGGMTAGSHCSICSKPVVVQNELPKLEITELEVVMPTKVVYYKNEDFDNTGLQVIAKLNNATDMDITEQVQLEGFSSNAAGTKTITVSYNDVQTSFDVYVFSFSSVSLSLEGRVILNFYANFPGMAEAGYTPGILFFREQPNASEIMRAYSVGEGINTYAVNDDGTLMFSYDKLAAKELNDKVYATLYVKQSDGNVVFGTPTPISAADYAISAFNRFADQPLLQTLMVDMLNFGAAAQNEFDYRTDALANSNMSAAMAAKATKDNVSLSNGMKLYNDGLSSDKVTIKSASLSLDNEISINFYAEIKGDIKKAELLIFDEYTAGGVYDKNTADIKRTDMVLHEGQYAGFIRNIAAKSMRDLYYARVYVQFGDGTEAYSGIGQYSVESYAWQVRNGSGFSSELKLLMEEMMKYGDSAKVYMANKNANANG